MYHPITEAAKQLVTPQAKAFYIETAIEHTLIIVHICSLVYVLGKTLGKAHYNAVTTVTYAPKPLYLPVSKPTLALPSISSYTPPNSEVIAQNTEELKARADRLIKALSPVHDWSRRDMLKFCKGKNIIKGYSRMSTDDLRLRILALNLESYV